jgi:hypothetical protein
MLETAWEPAIANMLATAGMPATTRRQQQQGHQGGNAVALKVSIISNMFLLILNKNKPF